MSFPFSVDVFTEGVLALGSRASGKMALLHERREL